MATSAIEAIPLSSINTTGLTGGYDELSSGLDFPCSFIRIINDSNRDVTISYDGTTAHDYVRAGSCLDINAQANSRLPNETALFRKGLPIYVNGTAGTGYIYAAGYHT